jgi:hypothetical protein
MKAVIDRIEEDWIVLVDEGEAVFEIPVSWFPEGVEGDHVEITIMKDISSQIEAEKRVEGLRSKLKRVSIGDQK